MGIDKNILKYIAKSRHEAIAEAYKSFDCYEVVLKDGWIWDGCYTMFISWTVEELRKDQQLIEREPLEN